MYKLPELARQNQLDTLDVLVEGGTVALANCGIQHSESYKIASLFVQKYHVS